MTGARISAAEARRLGIKVPRRKKEPGLKLPDLVGLPSLAGATERAVQRDVLAHFRRALPAGSKVFGHINQREFHPDMSDEQQHVRLKVLIGDGMEQGLLDLQALWDARHGAAGNRGIVLIELKRPIKPPEVSRKQLDFIFAMRAIGVVAGWAQSVEQAEQLFIEAGAPLRFRLPLTKQAPWWAPLGAAPPLYVQSMLVGARPSWLAGAA